MRDGGCAVGVEEDETVCRDLGAGQVVGNVERWAAASG